MDFIPYNSHDIYDKSVFGSVEAGTLLRFSVSLPKHYKCFWMNLSIRADGAAPSFFPMEKIAENRWSVEISPAETALYWYHFEYETDYGNNLITKKDYCRGQLSGGGADWQLTVFEKGFTTPEKFKGGVMYQIFPDRFYRSGKAKKDIPEGRILRGDWGGMPEWRWTSDNKILNNDYFGGDFEGIREKLPYIASLGVTCIYLNPIFEAHSNHRYDTADYYNTDQLLGTPEEFTCLCEDAARYGIDIILDGVFSHTGADSRYFNINRRYGEVGAYNSKNSEYYSWYKFKSWPDDYSCWWNVKILPEIDEENDGFIEFITGKNGVAANWLRLGAAGWRIDVADELPDRFIDSLRTAVKREKPDALLLGEVWEDASNKISHGGRRRYLLGQQFDSVMNYPFRDAIIEFMKTGLAEDFMEKISIIAENYPPQTLNLLMNHLGTHDTERILSVLSGADLSNPSREWQARLKLNEEQRRRAKKLLKMASVLQYTLPGIPSLYYGDEAGMEGGRDPFNRGCYPWGNEDSELLGHFAALGNLRKKHSAFTDGHFIPLSAALGCIAYLRQNENETLIIIANKNKHEITYYMPENMADFEILFGGEKKDGGIFIGAEESVMARRRD